MTREQILEEIRRTSKQHAGVPLGHRQFAKETGIRYYDWFGKYWARWGDALKEAGFAPNTLRDAFTDDSLIEKLIALTRDLGRFPGKGDLRLRKRSDPAFPNDKVFGNHFGSVAMIKKAVIEYCRLHPGLDDVPELCGPTVSSNTTPTEGPVHPTEVVGFVYLMRHGKHYKIGKTNAMGRREYELAIQLPEKLRTVHSIKTDDPDGIEAYWHKRFAAKRGNGEWFKLDAIDVQAFKRRTFM
jgi:hypothetical protein